MQEMLDADLLKQYIGANVRRLRIARGLSQGELAERIGINPVTMNRLEMGRNVPSVAVLFTLADVLGVPPDTLRALPATEAVSKNA